MKLDLLEPRRLLAGTGSISGAVYIDLNVNGVHEAGEAGIRRARVYLDANNNGAWDQRTELSAVTDKRGHYSFNNLAAGTYRVRQVLEENIAVTAPRSGWFRINLAEGQQVTRRLFGDALLARVPAPAGSAATSTDVLVQFTYSGEADFTGRVDFNDYTKIDTGFYTGRTGWLNGDFNNDGVINFDDYDLIDTVFQQTGGNTGTWLARPVPLPSSTPPAEPRTAKLVARADFNRTHDDHSLLPAKAWLSGNKNQRRTPGLQAVIDHYHEFGIDYKREFLRLARPY